MNTARIVLIAGAIAGALWLRKALRDSATFDVANVTETLKIGITGKSLTTTPIKTSAVAYVRSGSASDGSALSAIERLALPSSSFNSALRKDIFQLYGNTESARAAYSSPPRPDYAPTPYAGLSS